MVVHLVHQADDKSVAVVAALVRPGREKQIDQDSLDEPAAEGRKSASSRTLRSILRICCPRTAAFTRLPDR